jgi:hypothetical protein
MKKSLMSGLTAAVIAIAAPVFAADEFWDRLGDRIDQGLDARGVRMDERLDNLADKAQAEGKTKLAAHLDRRGDRIDNHLDRKGNRIDRRLDRFGRRFPLRG